MDGTKTKRKRRKDSGDETTPESDDPDESLKLKKNKVDYSPTKWPSSSSESGNCEPMQLCALNLPEDVTEPEVMAFFNGKPNRVVIYRVENQDSKSVIVFGSVPETKEALKLSGNRLRGKAIYVKPNGNSREIVRASGFSNQWTVKYVKTHLRKIFMLRGKVLHIFVPKNIQTGGCLGFGYIYIDPSQDTDEYLLESFEIDGLQIDVYEAKPKSCFEAEIVGKKKKENDEDEKTALKKMLLPLNTSLQTLLYTQSRSSWKDTRPDITAEPYDQESNDCWAATLQRAYSALAKLSGFESRPVPSKT